MAERLETDAERTGVVPSALRNRPQLLPYLGAMWTLFWYVSPSRQLSMNGVWYIPLTELVLAVQWQGWQAPEEQRWAVKMLQALDETYVGWHAEKAALERETTRIQHKSR